MKLKKLALTENIPLMRSKIVAGFGIWLPISLVLLSLVLLTTTSLKTRLVAPILQGFNSANSSRPFSLPNSSFVNSSVGDKPVEPNVVSVVLEKTHFGDEGKSGRFSEEGFGVEFNKTRFSDDGKNGSFGAEYSKTQFGNFSDHNGSLSGNSGVPLISSVNVSVIDVNNSRIVQNEISEVNSTKNENVVESKERIWRNGVSFEQCDIFDGNWVRDESEPYYPAGSCPHIDRDFNCLLNGRPDSDFVKWKWKPNGCDIPSLNATDFLERLRGQKLVFVGDSLNRNMWESLVCILRHSIKNKKTVFEISGRREFKKKGFYAFMFKDYNCTIDFVASPFLVRESSFKGVNQTLETLRLDLMDKTTSMYHDADIIVFNTGHWWTHEKTSRGENYYQEGNYVYPRLKVMEAYKKALLTWARWVDKNIDVNRTQVFFRGYSVTHFRGGRWNSGGQCHKETEPIFNPAYLSKYPSKMKVFQYVLHEMRTPVSYLNISRLTDYRKDGHPSIYRMKYNTEEERTAAEHAQDCSHWCLPGVPDTWNELLYISLLKAGKGSWRR